MLDSSNHLCRWVSSSSSSSSNNNNNNNNNEFVCESEPINMTVKTFVIISIYVSMFTALINLIVDFLFEDILSAPTMDSTKKNKSSSISLPSLLSKEKCKEKENNFDENENENIGENETRPESSLSKETQIQSKLKSQKSQLEKPTIDKLNSNEIKIKPRKTILDKIKDVETTRLVPSSTQEAHELAVISVKEIIKDQISNIKKNMMNQDSRHKTSTHLKQKSSLEKYRESLKYRGESQKVKSTKLRSNRSIDEVALEEQFLELTVDIMEQRKELKRNQQDGFDEMWGIDPTGEFSKQRQNYLIFWSESKSSEDIIKKELKFVHEETKKKSDKLEYASDVQTGLEILHHFILDLLGR